MKALAILLVTSAASPPAPPVPPTDLSLAVNQTGSAAVAPATLDVKLTGNSLAFAGDLAFVGASLSPIAPPGFPVFGGTLLVNPDALFFGTLAAWNGNFACASGGFCFFQGVALPVGPGSAGTTLHCQGFAFDPATITLCNTDVVPHLVF